MSLGLVLLLLGGVAFADDPEDDDGDGFGESAGDCDDANPDIFPGAPEHCDGIDEDCDDVVDNGTDCFDDDDDGFTEEEGDCDDADPSVHSEATEIADGVDGDCDGRIDNDTSVYDDDGDGLSEEEGDCDDADAGRSPTLDDWCRDGVDNDCSGLADDDCVEDPADGCDPDIEVAIRASRFSAPGGAEVLVTAQAIFEDRELDPQLLWQVEAGTRSGEGADVVWTLPLAPGSYTISVIAQDPCGDQAVDDLDIRVEMEDATAAPPATLEEGGCANSAVIGFFGLLGLSGLRRRRR